MGARYTKKIPEFIYFSGIGTWIETDTLLEELLYLSNLDYCQSSDDMQNHLEKINDLLKKEFQKLKEKE